MPEQSNKSDTSPTVLHTQSSAMNPNQANDQDSTLEPLAKSSDPSRDRLFKDFRSELLSSVDEAIDGHERKMSTIGILTLVAFVIVLVGAALAP